MTPTCAAYDHHCILSAGGYNWRITRMRGLGWIEVARLDMPQAVTALDLTRVNWASYIAAAQAMDARRDTEDV